MFDAVVDLVRRAALARPLLLVLEDVHWADASSLQLLRHLVGTLVNAPVMVACTRRTTETETSPGARGHVGGACSRGSRANPAGRA